MLTLPAALIPILTPFATLFQPRTWLKVQVLLKSLLDRPETAWESIAVNWYDGSSRPVEISSATAVWYNRGKPTVPIRWVLIRDPLGKFEPQALLCTDPDVPARQVIEWFVLCWQLEVTFRGVRAHLGVETQRQWSDRAIARTTPALFGLFSWSLWQPTWWRWSAAKPQRGMPAGPYDC